MANSLLIVTFNLRTTVPDDKINNFIHRVGGILEKIAAEKPDVIAFQEMTDKSERFLSAHLKDYTVFFNKRCADLSGEGLGIAVKRERLSLIGLDGFWLSPTPRIPGSRFEVQSPYPRVCQCALLQCRESGKVFRIYNVHLDHISHAARIEGIRCLLNYARQRHNELKTPFFMLGDFNAEPESETIQFCDNQTEILVRDLAREGGFDKTYHGFGLDAPLYIDYIYADEKTAAAPHTVGRWDDEKDGVYLSDHYPLFVRIEDSFLLSEDK